MSSVSLALSTPPLRRRASCDHCDRQFDKEAKAQVDQAVEEAKQAPEPCPKDLWTDIYYKGTEPPLMRGRERGEVRRCVS